ncbi:related to cactin [Lecanosticta acicola]|uniref:Splicing factor Cactin n=1 Tax=Lecanosticta acicola TaxID=111012 RepID=A0AAI8W0J4_9PEZI|nr:related to cactin [Lecanosticta acicola]
MSRSSIPSKRPAEAQEAAWVADEDRFVLQQAKKKAAIRVKGGRAQPIDWLAVTLAVIDPERNPLGDEVDASDLDLVDPEGVFEGMSDTQLSELEKGIDTYVTLETSRSNREYWNMMKTICKDRRKNLDDAQPAARGVSSIGSDLDKLLSPKSLEELEKLEKQIRAKLSSDEPIDTDYWEHLLKSLLTYTARAKLQKVSESILDARIGGLRKQQAAEATALRARLEAGVSSGSGGNGHEEQQRGVYQDERHPSDPEPLLRLRQEDKSLDSMTDKEFAQKINDDRRKVAKTGYVPNRKRTGELSVSGYQEHPSKRSRTDGGDSLFDRGVAKGLGENEALFAQEEEVTTKNLSSWSSQYRPRKPKYFARLQLGYEWNKYNQTHYDHENPPPKVVQGYRFNVFYPELVDKMKAPTYRIERENGRKRGQTLAPAGEDDTCLIRFVAGPPYEDIAFRIVDKEWDYSAKRERGFRSSFDKGILQLHFQFKKIYYRK